MSQKELQAIKEQNTLQELAGKADLIKQEIEKTSKVVIYGRIMEVGAPKIYIDSVEPPKFKMFQSKKKAVQALNNKLVEILKSFYQKCEEIGIFPMAQISPYGAQISYVLTKAKKKELNPVIIPVEKPKIIIPVGSK